MSPDPSDRGHNSQPVRNYLPSSLEEAVVNSPAREGVGSVATTMPEVRRTGTFRWAFVPPLRGSDPFFPP